MHWIVIKSRWRNRWHVYSMGHLEGDQTWLAAFRNKADAFRFAGITRGDTRGEVVQTASEIADVLVATGMG